MKSLSNLPPGVTDQMIEEAQGSASSERAENRAYRAPAHTPTPWTADLGDRATDGSDCWVIDSDEGSIAEMMCPAHIERANAKFIVRAVKHA